MATYAIVKTGGKQYKVAVGDVVKVEPQVTPIDPGFDFPDTAEELAAWCGGEITWTADDLAVVRATYD